MEHLAPVRHLVVVDGDPVDAFEVFTAIDRWWPLRDRHVLGVDSSVTFAEGRLVERSNDGEIAVWGTVTGWVPGASVSLSWHPGRSAELAGQLSVSFSPAGAQTLVTLEHEGWSGYGDPAGARRAYDLGWPRVLGLYRATANGRMNQKS